MSGESGKAPESPRSGKPVRGADLATEVHGQLRELIVRGRLAPGARIMETELATRLGVSRTPVRAALLRLRQEGYVVSADRSQQVRLWVAPLTLADARELIGIVSELESLAATWAVGRPADERAAACADLGVLNDRFAREAGREDRDPKVLCRLDREFHQRLVDAGGGPRLLALHATVKPQVERYIVLYLSALMDWVGESVMEHQSIISAIESGSGTAARRAVLGNWVNAGRRLEEVMRQLGERAIW